MLDHPEMTARHARILCRLSELELSAAELLHGDILSADTPDARAVSARAFHQTCRGVRQTVALEAGLQRDDRRDDAGDRALAARQAEARVEHRRAHARAAVARAVWTETEHNAEAEDRLAVLDDLLLEDRLSGELMDGPLEAYVARLCFDLGVDPLADPTHPDTSYTPAMGEPRGAYTKLPAHQRPRRPRPPIDYGAYLDDDEADPDGRDDAEDELGGDELGGDELGGDDDGGDGDQLAAGPHGAYEPCWAPPPGPTPEPTARHAEAPPPPPDPLPDPEPTAFRPPEPPPPPPQPYIPPWERHRPHRTAFPGGSGW